MEFFRETHIRFTSKMRFAFVFSMILIVASVVSLIAHGGPRLSIDFTGGTILQVNLQPRPTVAQVRSALTAGGFSGVQVQEFGDQDYLITLPRIEDPDVDAAAAMKTALAAAMPDVKIEVSREESVGPKIGSELRTAALNSIFGALLLIVLYITVRFVFRYGLAAILALVHDVTITLGVFSILQKEISLSIIAAFLTIIGYSLNDTIVVFDRIRENMRMRRRESYNDVIDRSINETLSRTILTALTTLFVSAALWILGGPVIADFAFALTFGVVIGTYSSIFIASPILVWWMRRRTVDSKRARQPAL